MVLGSCRNMPYWLRTLRIRLHKEAYHNEALLLESTVTSDRKAQPVILNLFPHATHTGKSTGRKNGASGSRNTRPLDSACDFQGTRTLKQNESLFEACRVSGIAGNQRLSTHKCLFYQSATFPTEGRSPNLFKHLLPQLTTWADPSRITFQSSKQSLSITVNTQPSENIASSNLMAATKKGRAPQS